MRRGLRSLVGAFCVLSIAAAAGCGGGLEETRSEPVDREADELRAREWPDRVVRLGGEAELAAERGEECASRCALAARACELTQRICDLAASDSNDEGTSVLCEDARPRCDRARAASDECDCGSAGE
jgi:hypothetical protein